MPRTQGWIVGRDPGINPPACLQESGLLHALLLVEQCITAEGVTPPFFYIKTGTWRMIRGLQTWFNSGRLQLKSLAASDIVAAVYCINLLLPRPLIITALPTDFFETAKARGVRDCDVLLTTSSRLYSLILPKVIRRWGARLARIPWTEDETEIYCKIKYRADEEVAPSLLKGEGPIASSIYAELHLTRSIIKEVLTRLRSDRRKQMVFASIVFATRFKTFAVDNEPQAAKCMRCGERDTFDHTLQCCRVGDIPCNGNAENLLDFLVGLVREAAKGAPVRPIRLPLPDIDEISLTAEDNEEMQTQSEEESLDSLSFDLVEEGTAPPGQ